MKRLCAFAFPTTLLLAGFCAFSSPLLAQTDEPAEDSAAAATAPEPDQAAGTTPAAGVNDAPLTGIEILEKYSHLPRVELENGVYYQDIAVGTGKTPEEGAVIFLMIKSYDASAGEIVMGDPAHDDPESTPSVEPQTGAEYNVRWTHFGTGGGNLSFGVPKLEELFFKSIGNMKEMGARLIYIPSDQAYGEKGYTGQSLSIPPNMDLVMKASLLRVRSIEPPRNLGFVNTESGERETE